jgi:SAM-dependent methyltransferase
LYERYFAELAPAGLDERAEEQRRLQCRRLIDEIRAASAGRRPLDVEAGTGTLVAEARAGGFEAEGIELSRDGAESALRRYGIELRRATLGEAGFPPERFDVVVAWHVIEHVIDLDGFVRALHRVLRPGGLVVVGTESYAYPANTVLRASAFVRGALPARGDEHAAYVRLLRAGAARLLRAPGVPRALRRRLRAGARGPSRGGRCPLDLARALARAVVLLAEAGARASRRGPYLRAAFERVP